jgi:NAD(P)-dependent dehydrogenase (short-subunit alcohol dehydrogenase family)
MHGIHTGRAGRPPDTVVVTGASTGLGLETALRLAGEGFTVFAGVRDLSKRPDVLQAAAERGVQVAVLKLDLTDSSSIDEAVSSVVAATGGIFALVNNGGIGLRGCLEDCSEEEIRRVFETNVLGTIALTKAVLPHMRAAGCGRVVTVSSVGGRVCGFGVSVYCASKFAQEGLGEALALELAPFGVQSVLVEPGIIDTSRWRSHRGTAKGANDPDSPYHALFWASEAEADRIVERSPTRPADVAEAIRTAVTAEQPKMRYVVGRGATVVIALRRYLPQSLFERLYFGGQLRRLEGKARAGQSPRPQVRAVR